MLSVQLLSATLVSRKTNLGNHNRSFCIPTSRTDEGFLSFLEFSLRGFALLALEMESQGLWATKPTPSETERSIAPRFRWDRKDDSN